MSGAVVGLISDTHDNLPLVRRAAELFTEVGARPVLHLGDVTTPEALAPLAGFDLVVVEGNNDGDPRLRAAVRDAGGFYGDAWRGDVDGAPALALHGHRVAATRRAVASGAYRYVFKGHSHRPGEAIVGPTRVVNPGALWRTRVRTVATFEPGGAGARFYEVMEDGWEALSGAPETGYASRGGIP